MHHRKFVKKVASRTHISEDEVDALLQSIVDVLAEAMAAREPVELDGFGTFTTRTSRPRTVININTREKIVVSPRLCPHFEPGQTLINAVEPKRIATII